MFPQFTLEPTVDIDKWYFCKDSIRPLDSDFNGKLCLCNTDFCNGVGQPVDGGWGEFKLVSSSEGDCSADPVGQVLKQRECDNPHPINGGALCIGMMGAVLNETKWEDCDPSE